MASHLNERYIETYEFSFQKKTERKEKRTKELGDKHYSEKEVQIIFGIMINCLEIIREVKSAI